MSKEKNYEQTVKEQFPNLRYDEFKIVDNRQERLAIDDLSFKNPLLRPKFKEAIELFTLACKGFINFYDAEELTSTLIGKLEVLLNKLESERTFLVFPGKGSQPVRDLLPKQIFSYFPYIDLQACRTLSENMRVEKVDILTGKEQARKVISPKTTTYVLIDDVIASGTTAQAVKQFLDRGGNCEWYSASWMTLSPLQTKERRTDDIFKSSLPGFQNIITSTVYQGISGIPANNSISSFVESDEKAAMVIGKYQSKYVEDQQTFDQAINDLRRLNNG